MAAAVIIYLFILRYILSKVRCPSDLLVFLQGHARLCSILSLNEDQLVSLDIFQDTLQTNIHKKLNCSLKLPSKHKEIRREQRKHLKNINSSISSQDIIYV